MADRTHFLGRAASLPPNGYSDYMATCFSSATYRLHSLQSFAQAKMNKTGACILFHILPRESSTAARTIDELIKY